METGQGREEGRFGEIRVETSRMSEDVEERYLSEGEVLVPERSKKSTSNQDKSQVVGPQTKPRTYL
jgi:hypothetical protein